MNKIITTIIFIVIILLAAGYFLLKNPQSPTPSSNITVQTPLKESQTNLTPDTETPIKTPVTEKTSEINEAIVVYTNLGYSPSALRVKIGATVTFKNESSKSMWIASAIHPTHLSYPTSGGCIGSTFDACQGIKLGDSWSFKFDIAGTWKYHNHLSPGDVGIITVE